MALNEIHTRLSIKLSKTFNVLGHFAEWVMKYIEFLRESLDLKESFQLEIETVIPVRRYSLSYTAFI